MMLRCPLCGRESFGICAACTERYMTSSNAIVDLARSMAEEIDRQRNQPWYLELQSQLELQQRQAQEIGASLEATRGTIDAAEISRIQDAIQDFRTYWERGEAACNPTLDYQATLEQSPVSSILQNLELARRRLEEDSLLLRFVPSAVELEAILQHVHIPTRVWLDSQSAQEVFVMTAMASRSIAENPYSDSATAILRSQLGDFRVYDESLADSDPTTRQKLRAKAGADPNIAKVEVASLEIILSATGIKLPDPPPLLDPPAEVVEFVTQSGDDRFHHDWLRYIENKLRILIKSILEREAGRKWIKQRVPEEIRKRWNDRKNSSEEAKNSPSQLCLIYFADFSDYPQIITKSDNWKFFEKIFIRKESLLESFNRISPIRNDLSHGRPLSKEDGYCFHCEVLRLYRLIVEWEKTCEKGTLQEWPGRMIRWSRAKSLVSLKR